MLQDAFFLPYLHLNTSFSEHIGLANGKSGSILFFSSMEDCYFKNEISFRHLDEILAQIDINSPLSFGNGLAGIGVTVEYLAKQGILTQDTNSLLDEIDACIIRKVQDEFFENLDLSRGLGGFGLFLVARYNSKYPPSEEKRVILRECILIVLQQIDRNLSKFGISDINYASIWNGFSGLLLFLQNVNRLEWGVPLVQELVDKVQSVIYNHLRSSTMEWSYAEGWFVLAYFGAHQIYDDFLISFKKFTDWCEESFEDIELSDAAFHTLLLRLVSEILGDDIRLQNVCKNLISRINDVLKTVELIKDFPFYRDDKGVSVGLQRGVSGTALSLHGLKTGDHSWLQVFGIDIHKRHYWLHDKND